MITKKMAKEIKVQSHILVPNHSVVDKQEVDKILFRYNISLQQMPIISIKDPALEGLEINSGDVIEIIRNSPTQGKSVYYRRVVE